MKCGCCPKDWPEGTVMRMGRSVGVCPDCVAHPTPISRHELETDTARDQRLYGGYRPNKTAFSRFDRAMGYWLRNGKRSR